MTHGFLAAWVVAAAFALLAPCGALRAAVGDTASGVDRYRVILDRQPFGASLPVGAVVQDAPIAPLPPVADFARDLRLVALTERGGKVQAGIVDIKTNRSYYLRVGDIQDGIELVGADYEGEAALVRRDGGEAWLQMGARGAAGAAPAVAASLTSAAAGAGIAPRPASGIVRPGPVAAPGASLSQSYAERLRERQRILEERRRKSAERTQAGPEVLKEQLMQYQMELIRAGGELGPALPIPLTKEMDEQLVAEGVLPARE